MLNFNISKAIEEQQQMEDESEFAGIQKGPYYGTEEREDIREFMLGMNVESSYIPDDPMGFEGQIEDPGKR